MPKHTSAQVRNLIDKNYDKPAIREQFGHSVTVNEMLDEYASMLEKRETPVNIKEDIREPVRQLLVEWGVMEGSAEDE